MEASGSGKSQSRKAIITAGSQNHTQFIIVTRKLAVRHASPDIVNLSRPPGHGLFAGLSFN